MKYNALQSKLELIGSYGCYFLSICAALDFQGDLVDLYDYCVSQNWMTSDCEILQPQLIAERISGKKYKVVKTSELPNTFDFYVIKYYNPRTKYSHFRLATLDTLASSVTVREGHIDSYRVFTCL